MFIILILLAVFVVLLLSNTRSTAGCRWREDRAARSGEIAYWRCHVCGATEKTVKGREPNACRARTRGPRL